MNKQCSLKSFKALKTFKEIFNLVNLDYYVIDAKGLAWEPKRHMTNPENFDLEFICEPIDHEGPLNIVVTVMDLEQGKYKIISKREYKLDKV